ncbi:MAG: hypothetical protein ACXVO9_04475 [Bacteroidia bacterium]
MIKLKKIIAHLDDEVYNRIEDTLVKNKADNFLFLLNSYRKEAKDNDIIDHLNLNTNSFYVLKSRLYDKIQEQLSGNIYLNREELVKKLNLIPEMCVKEPREVTIAFLQKIEKDLLEYDMHNELLVVYSALKKMHLYSEKYFYYSQLYNKQIAFGLSLEKSEEILGHFNRVLGQYDFSRSSKLLETLLFMRKEVNDHYALNPSRQIEMIKNFIELQLCVFCYSGLNKEINVEELLHQTDKLISELPESSAHKTWMPALDHLFFEYYLKNGNLKQAQVYYDKVNNNQESLLLYSHISNVSAFLISKIIFLQQKGCAAELANEAQASLIQDSSDMHTKVVFGFYESMIAYYTGNYKEAANKLNTLLNENSFKDYFHISTDIKLSLAFIYLRLKEFGLADSIIKGVYRKIKSEKIENYTNVLDLVKVFEMDMKNNGGKLSEKQKDHFTLFKARNKDESKMLSHLVNELEQKYS